MNKGFAALFLFCFLLLPAPVDAQDWIGIITDNHAGIPRMHIQPASIVSSPWKWDVHPLGADLSAVNMGVLDAVQAAAGGDPLPLVSNTDELFLKANIQGPSFLLRLGDRSAIGLELKLRSLIFSETSDSRMLDLLRDNFNRPDFFGIDFSEEFFRGRAHLWWEVSGTYAYRFLRNSTHQLNGGLTLRYLGGMASGYFDASNLAFVLQNENDLGDLTGSLQFVYNESLDKLIEQGKVDLFSNPGFGAALGLEYLFSPDPRGYRLKLGLAVLDLGSIRYQRSGSSGQYVADFQDIDLARFKNSETLEELGAALEDVFQEIAEAGGGYTMFMPTRLGLQADYFFGKIYYLNFSAYLTLGNNVDNIRSTALFSRYILTPRIEKPTWSIQLPLHYNRLIGLSSGISARLGPVYLGSDNIWSALIQGNGANRLNVFLGFRFGGRMSDPLPNNSFY